MQTLTYFEFLTFGYSDKLKRLKVDFTELKLLFLLDNAQAVNLENMQIISYR